MENFSAMLTVPGRTFTIKTVDTQPLNTHTARVSLKNDNEPERLLTVLSVEENGATVEFYCVDGSRADSPRVALCVGTNSRSATVSRWDAEGFTLAQQATSKKAHFDLEEATLEEMSIGTPPNPR